MSRIDLLRKFTEDEPDDPFNWYALALEVQKENLMEALSLFSMLMSKHPSYIPTYYQAGKLLCETGREEDAKKVYSIGISKAKEQQDLKALGELRAALDELTDW